ncbi:Tellurite resistance protein TerC OS=Streptomyces griseomycini OX=66895 GN=FHS37_000190 PE=3 SV=1 [Streptomyces griseomycini]
MGLRQLYFLIGGLLKKLVHLSYGLSIILGFIGVKLVLHALHESGVHVRDQHPGLTGCDLCGPDRHHDHQPAACRKTAEAEAAQGPGESHEKDSVGT